ncbi:hypothetical protein HJG60_008970 [Phyllostomus discolor]|uniref:Uncharacterized protein n=1 Tax=Phyllostomus discolor TaxID=89673 RepID=A0A833YSY8_9CHIR|nr:hypothetical protein HJG60_008970 [Phyllostomus discolor]
MNQSKPALGLWVGGADRERPTCAANRREVGRGCAGGHLGETPAEDGTNPGTNGAPGGEQRPRVAPGSYARTWKCADRPSSFISQSSGHDPGGLGHPGNVGGRRAGPSAVLSTSHVSSPHRAPRPSHPAGS